MAGNDFVRALVAEDVKAGSYGRPVMTRFPPEPNGYLHIGHAKSICLNFGVANEFGGVCNLRFDDTNPVTEDSQFAESIQEDVRWLGFDWGDRLYFASDYFERLYEIALKLIRDGNAYVDSLNDADIREYRGTVTRPGRNSPYRDRSVEENLELFSRMRSGEFPDGAHVLRARIDMSAPNMIMRDPLCYRIRHAHHYRTGDDWCIYPFYDFAHGLSDAMEGVTHSLCSLEFKDNRELYDWFVSRSGISTIPHQTEFARLALDYTVLSKRKLIKLVNDGLVDGWDDPRMPTLAGLRRRGVTPEAIRKLCEVVGVARVNSRVDLGKLDFCIRDDLNHRVPRVMCVMKPLKVVITNYPEDRTETFEAPLYPHDVPLEGTRAVPFARELYIERDDFMEEPVPGFFRLSPGKEVRLRYAYYITCDEVVKDDSGDIVELRCSYDPDTRGGTSASGRKIKGTLHWVSAQHGVAAEVRLYDRLFAVPDPEAGDGDFTDHLNPESKVILTSAWIEPSVRGDPPGTRYQFERLGYFISDEKDSASDHLVFNRTVTLRDSWAREEDTSRPNRVVPEVRSLIEPGIPGSRPERTESQGRRFHTLVNEVGLSEGDADTLARRGDIDAFFVAVQEHADPAMAASWIVNELAGVLKGSDLADMVMSANEFGALVNLVAENKISRSVGKELLGELVVTGGDPVQIVHDRGLQQVGDRDAINELVMKVMHANPDKVSAYKDGRKGMAGFFVGQVMREGGTLDPKVVSQMVREALS